MYRTLVIVSFVLLSACARAPDHFNCPLQSGISCHSLSEVNAMLDTQMYSKANNAEALKVWLPSYKDSRGVVSESHWLRMPAVKEQSHG